jgi:hypothetical protein
VGKGAERGRSLSGTMAAAKPRKICTTVTQRSRNGRGLIPIENNVPVLPDWETVGCAVIDFAVISGV